MTHVNIEIDRFSGPLALLLHLIRQEEMDIFDINIHQITKQYLESIKQIKKLNLEVAGEFIAMAATLIQIKSKMLLPQYNENGEVVEAEDPRKDLVRRLLEYQMYQEAGQKLYQVPLLNRDVWARGDKEKIEVPESDVVLEEGNALYSLIAAYRHAIKNMKKAVHKVASALQSIADRIWEMRERLVVGRQVRFSELIEIGPSLEGKPEERRGRILITFLSLLEMAKIGLVSLFQSENYSDIHVDPLKEVTRDVISNVENYEAAKNVGGVTEISMDEVEPEEPAAETAEAEPPAQMSFADGAGAYVAESFEEEAATDEEIEEALRAMESETEVTGVEAAGTEDWSNFTINVEGAGDGQKVEVEG